MTTTKQTDEQPALDPADFDLDGWLDGVTRNRAVVTLNARQDLAARVDELVEELQQLNDAATAAAKRKGDESLADVGTAANREGRDAKRAELEQAWRDFEASGADFELTQMTVAEYDRAIATVNERHPEAAFDATDEERARVQQAREDLGGRLILLASLTAVGPHGKPRTDTTLTEAQLDKMESKFGLRQLAELVGKARELTLLSIEVDAPFSQRVSDALTADTTGN